MMGVIMGVVPAQRRHAYIERERFCCVAVYPELVDECICMSNPFSGCDEARFEDILDTYRK